MIRLALYTKARPTEGWQIAGAMIGSGVTFAAFLIGSILGWTMLVLAAAGTVYTLAAALVLRHFFKGFSRVAPSQDGVTILKPLRGGEPRLADNLATFLAQDHLGPIQLLCGVQSASDPAIGAVEALRRAHPAANIDLVVDPTAHGANGKVANLINMVAKARHETLVLSDSDIAVAPDYLGQILAALAVPGTGVVTCAYIGRGDGGFWSRFGAAGLSYQTLPGVIFGVAAGLARPCMGSTIALRRATLDRIGGFAAFADVLADDYAIGAAVAALGLGVAVPPIVVTHASIDDTLADLWRHEVRWGATVRDLVPPAYAASIIGIPFPLALLGALYWPVAGLLLALAALIARIIAVSIIDRAVANPATSRWLLPLRDCFTLAIFASTFFARSVDWRGTKLRMTHSGRILTGTETPA